MLGLQTVTSWLFVAGPPQTVTSWLFVCGVGGGEKVGPRYVGEAKLCDGNIYAVTYTVGRPPHFDCRN